MTIQILQMNNMVAIKKFSRQNAKKTKEQAVMEVNELKQGMYKTKSKLDDLVETNKILDLAYVENISWRNMMTQYYIIQYCVPNNKWMMPMLNLMSGGPWEMVEAQF